MDIDVFESVIKMTLTDHAGETPEQQTAAILSAMRIADAIASRMSGAKQPQQARPVLVTPGKPAAARSKLVLPETEGAILIGGPPPVAGTDEDAVEDAVEYWRPTQLLEHLNKILPETLDVTVPGVGKVTLYRNVSRPNVLIPMGHRGPEPVMPTVYVTYALQGAKEGIRTTVMITTPPKDISVEKILEEIHNGALTLVSREQRKPMPKSTPHPGAPTAADFERARVNSDSRNMVSDHEITDPNEYQSTVSEMSSARQKYMQDNPLSGG